MNRYCSGEHLNDSEIYFVSRVISYVHLKNEANVIFKNVNLLTQHYRYLLNFEGFILDECLIDEISVDLLYSYFCQLNRDFDFEKFSDFILGLNLQIKELYRKSDIYEAIEIKQIITQEKINQNLFSLSNAIINLNQAVEDVFNGFHSQN